MSTVSTLASLSTLASFALAVGGLTGDTILAEPGVADLATDSVVITPSDGDTFLTVPEGVRAVTFAAQGGSGGDASFGAKGGAGGLTGGAFYVTPGQQIRVGAGQAGMSGAAGWGLGEYIGGAPGAPGWTSSGEPVTAGGGGGASVIILDGVTITVAGGGGGAGAAPTPPPSVLVRIPRAARAGLAGRLRVMVSREPALPVMVATATRAVLVGNREPRAERPAAPGRQLSPSRTRPGDRAAAAAVGSWVGVAAQPRARPRSMPLEVGEVPLEDP